MTVALQRVIAPPIFRQFGEPARLRPQLIKDFGCRVDPDRPSVDLVAILHVGDFVSHTPFGGARNSFSYVESQPLTLFVDGADPVARQARLGDLVDLTARQATFKITSINDRKSPVFVAWEVSRA